MYLELISPPAAGTAFRYAVLDFDGTISLIREGWQDVMVSYFTQLLVQQPGAHACRESELASLAKEFITLHTGKQTIYQCIALAQEIANLGGKPEDPQVYKDEYHRRLLERIDSRLRGLQSGELRPEDYLVPGSLALLEMLKGHGLRLCLASGTDEEYVLKEAKLLMVDRCFEGRIYGARRDYKSFSKKMVIERLLKENDMRGTALLGFGDGYVEIENVTQAGGYAVGVASDEARRAGVDQWKRERLLRAGARMIVPDYTDIKALERVLFEK